MSAKVEGNRVKLLPKPQRRSTEQDRLEQRLAALEARIAALEEKMARPGPK